MSKNIPAVRFEGFSEDWCLINLSELMDFSNGINAPKESYGKGRKMISVMDILDESYLKYENIRSSVEVSPFIEEKNKVEYGDLIFVRSSEVSEEVGWSKAYLEKEYALYSGFSIRGKKKGDFNPSFVELSLNYTNRKQIERKAGGSTRFNISQAILNTIEILKASYEEQQKIGDFFKQLDDTIALQQQLVEQQQQYKKAMLQKMFPRKGEHLPQVRFEGFSGDWINQKISNLVTPVVREVSKPTHSYKRLSVRSHAKGTFHQIVEDPSTVSMDKLYVIKENDLVVNITFAWEHAIAVAKKEDEGLLVSHRFPTFIIDKSDINFIQQLVSKENFRRKLDLISPGGAGRNRVLNKNDFINLNVLVPKSLEEQQKIGAFFKQLDDTIALHQKKLEDTQQLKKALLQRMFV